MDTTVQGLIPDTARDFIFSRGTEIGSGVHPVSYLVGNNGSLPEGKLTGV